MNKQIKDLTTEEIEKICNKSSCISCPLRMDLAGRRVLDVFVCIGRIVNKLNNEVTLDE